MLKEKIIDEISKLLEYKISEVEEELNLLTKDKNEITKSSAGDKFETSRATIQSEFDKVSINLIKLKDQLRKIKLISITSKPQKIGYGTLVKTSNSMYMVSIGYGKLRLDSKDIYVISPLSPIGKKLINKQEGESISFNSKNEEILEIF
tara:strand:- start:3064 stop:3510 length:447 start_codon:yes stop_codon:yes gene_type:complete